MAGVCSDTTYLPYSVIYIDLELGWITLIEIFYRSVKTLSLKTTTKVRTIWESIDLFQSSGLSTYCSGGGFHAEPIGISLT